MGDRVEDLADLGRASGCCVVRDRRAARRRAWRRSAGGVTRSATASRTCCAVLGAGIPARRRGSSAAGRGPRERLLDDPLRPRGSAERPGGPVKRIQVLDRVTSGRDDAPSSMLRGGWAREHASDIICTSGSTIASGSASPGRRPTSDTVQHRSYPHIRHAARLGVARPARVRPGARPGSPCGPGGDRLDRGEPQLAQLARRGATPRLTAAAAPR